MHTYHTSRAMDRPQDEPLSHFIDSLTRLRMAPQTSYCLSRCVSRCVSRCMSQALSALSFLATHSSPLHRYSMPAQPYHIQPPMAPAVPAAYLR